MISQYHHSHRGGRGDWVSPRGGKTATSLSRGVRNRRFLRSDSDEGWYWLKTEGEDPEIWNYLRDEIFTP